jgi:hypothetical protein
MYILSPLRSCVYRSEYSPMPLHDFPFFACSLLALLARCSELFEIELGLGWLLLAISLMYVFMDCMLDEWNI